MAQTGRSNVRYVDPQRRYTVVLGPSWNAPFGALPHDDRAGTHDSAESVQRTVSALRRLEQWCDPLGRLAASERPSRGITVRFEDMTRPAATDIGSVGPLGVSTPSGLPRGRACRTDCSARRPPCAFRFPSEVHRSTPAPSRTPEGTLVRRCFLPWASLPHDTCRNGGSSPRGVQPRSAPRGVWIPHRDHPAGPPGTLRPPSVHGLHPSRRSPRAGRTPSRAPLPSCRSPRRFASPLRSVADAVGFRASIPAASSF